MLKEMIAAMIGNATLRAAFARKPGEVFKEFAVSPDEQKLLRLRDERRLSDSLGPKLYEQFRALSAAPQILLYPGVVTLQITGVDIERAADDPLQCTLTVSMTWGERVVPQYGLPAWMQIRTFDADGVEVAGDRTNSFVVPFFMDFDNAVARARRVVVFPAAGDYKVSVDASGSREALPSAPVVITI